MGAIKHWMAVYRDHRGAYPEDNEDFWLFIEHSGGRLGLTDEQLREIGDSDVVS